MPNLCAADKLLQTKLREKEIKDALKEKKHTEKEEKEQVRVAAAVAGWRQSLSRSSATNVSCCAAAAGVGAPGGSRGRQV